MMESMNSKINSNTNSNSKSNPNSNYKSAFFLNSLASNPTLNSTSNSTKYHSKYHSKSHSKSQSKSQFKSNFSTSSILTENGQSEPYSLVTSYLSSLSPVADAEISTSFYSEIEDLFQSMKTKLEATSFTSQESDYCTYADIVYALGLCYRQSDPFTMLRMMYQAAVRGHPKAQYLLGKHFLLGQVLPFSLKFGVHWLTLSADQGHPEALYDLSCLFPDWSWSVFPTTINYK